MDQYRRTTPIRDDVHYAWADHMTTRLVRRVDYLGSKGQNQLSTDLMLSPFPGSVFTSVVHRLNRRTDPFEYAHNEAIQLLAQQLLGQIFNPTILLDMG